jgi:hypothetical protein
MLNYIRLEPSERINSHNQKQMNMTQSVHHVNKISIVNINCVSGL